MHALGSEMRALANDLNYDREVIRVWFCNKRQALKNSAKRIKQSTPNGESNNQHISPQNSTKNLSIDPLLNNEFRIFKTESNVADMNSTFSNLNNSDEDKPDFQSIEKFSPKGK